MIIKFYGVRGSIPTPSTRKINYHKYGGNTSCLSVAETKNSAIILDAGSGIRALGDKLCAFNSEGKVLEKNDFNSGKAVIDIFLGHLHWDHIIGLPFFKPIYIPGNIINIYGCPGLKKSLPFIFKKPFFPINFNQLLSDVNLIEIKEKSVTNVNSYKFKPVFLSHPDPTYGYRITKDKKVFCYATDTEHTDDDSKYMDALCKNADALVFDTHFTHQEYDPAACEKRGMSKKHWGHSIAQEGIKISSRNNVKRLIPFHYSPESPDNKIDDIIRFVKKYNRKLCSDLKIIPSYEGMSLKL